MEGIVIKLVFLLVGIPILVTAKTITLKEWANAGQEHRFQKKNKLSTCEDVSTPMCSHIGYNMTVFPNSLHHMSQEEAALEVHQFEPLVEVGCSPFIR